MKTTNWVILFLLAAAAVACGGRGHAPEMSADSFSGSDAKMAYEADESYRQPTAPGSGEAAPQEDVQQDMTEKKIIRTANIRMEVRDFKEAQRQIAGLVSRFEGEVISEEVQQYGEMLENRMVLKVRPERFDSMLTALEQLATYVDFRSVNAEDVTRQYIDLETRLSSKRAVVERYRELLKQAKNVQEVLAVEENMRKVVEEIESIEGQLRYLSRQVDYSTINLTYYEKTDQPLIRRSFWSRVGEGFSRGWQLLKDLAIGAISIWPVILLIAALLWWWARRRKQ
ncbi:MAG: DUF4349 domain-containing protein [Phaeodactylibacter sp.]|nr:DUF4349 domain-containing protein [Phaeodactylibacter sp.]MCB9276988.1 DUF4349 domain-containing protein [Lewinellaceae bacterium]